MAQLTFFSVLKSNIRCALCKKSKCKVRFSPERKKYYVYGGTRYVAECEIDKVNRENAIIKKKYLDKKKKM